MLIKNFKNVKRDKIKSGGAVAQLEHDLAYHKKLLNETYENEQSKISMHI